MPNISTVLANIGNFIFDYWYVFVIFILAIIVINLLIKNKKDKIEYYSQIKENKRIMTKELEYNPPDFKWLRHFEKKYKIIGQSYVGFTEHEKPELKQRTNKEWTSTEIRSLEIQKLKEKITNETRPKYIAYKFLIQRSNFLGIYFGEKEIVVLFKDEFTQTKKDTIRLHSDRHLIYRKGMLVSQSMEMIEVVDDNTERIMADHHVDARGQQMKDFSRIRTDYSHEEKMKDKDIEVEEKKEKGKRFG